jgi:hypothetical protein
MTQISPHNSWRAQLKDWEGAPSSPRPYHHPGRQHTHGSPPPLQVLASLDLKARRTAHASPELYDAKEMHVDALHRAGLLKPLTLPFEVFQFDWLKPPGGRRTHLKARHSAFWPRHSGGG